MKIRLVESSDAASIAEIYNYYIINSHATFEFDPIDAAEMRNRISSIISDDYPFLVCEDESQLAGYAYAHPYRPRAAYKYSVETSVYIKPSFERRGIGTSLYTPLLEEIRKRDFHAVIAGISLPNEASVRLHEKFGFQKVAHFKEVGFKFERWIDVGYWQLNY
jgi:L-amino acid N-acyltransferase YncA